MKIQTGRKYKHLPFAFPLNFKISLSSSIQKKQTNEILTGIALTLTHQFEKN